MVVAIDNLIDGVICWVEGTEVLKRTFLEWEEECRRDALVDCVLCNIDKQQRKHTVALR